MLLDAVERPKLLRAGVRRRAECRHLTLDGTRLHDPTMKGSQSAAGRRRRSRFHGGASAPVVAASDRPSRDADARVDETIAESFPASDPPCWTLGSPTWARATGCVAEAETAGDQADLAGERVPLRVYERSRVIVLRASATAFEAARAMRLNEIGCVLVRDQSGEIGIVTDRDLALRVLAEGLDAQHTVLSKVMSRHLVALPSDATTSSVLRLMRERGVRRVPITSHNRVVGMVTLDDLVIDFDGTGALAAVVRAQIVETGPARTRRYDEWRAWTRRYARAERTRARLVRQVREATAIASTATAESALVDVLATVLRCMKPLDATRLLGRIPTLLRDRLPDPETSFDPSASVADLERRIAATLGADDARAAMVVESIGGLLGRLVLGRREVERMPEELAALIDPRRARWAATHMVRAPGTAGPQRGDAGAPQ